MSYQQWKWNRKKKNKKQKDLKDNYYISKGTSVRILEENNHDCDIKYHSTRQDLTFNSSDEIDAPKGWRAFKRAGYILQAEEQDVFYGEFWTLF